MARPPTHADILTQYELRKRFWQPRDQRMDLWHLTYLLFDAHQMAKPPGRMRFISNEPANIIDKGAAAIATNHIKLTIPIENVDSEEERGVIARCEDLGYGIFDEMDEALANRGAPGTAREIASKQALLRGWICSHQILQPQSDRGFLWYDDWDPRFTYPDYDRWGMRSVLNYSETTLGDLLGDAPHLEQYFDMQDDFNMRVQQFIWYDREYYGCLAFLPNRKAQRRNVNVPDLFWLSVDPDTDEPGPYKHGLPDIPVVMLPVNGMNFKYAPNAQFNSAFETLQAQRDLRWAEAPNRYELYRFGPNHWVAERGRSIFANVERSFKQMNELVATVWQVVNNEAYGTWTFKSRDGKLINLQIGNNAVNPLRLDEQLEKIQPHIAPPSITDLLSISSREVERGTFSFQMFGDAFDGSGFLFNQVQKGLANALQPFSSGVERWAERVARIALRQFRMGDFQDLTLYGRRPQSRNTFMCKLSSDMINQDYRINAKLQLSVPEDMLSKIQMARLLLDPRRPMASLQTVFDKILGWDDPDGEKTKIFEDVADTDPIIILERIARALEKRGLVELAQGIRDKEFMAKAAQELQKAQIEGAAQQMLSAGGGADSRSGGQSVSPPNPQPTGQPAPDATASMGSTY